MIPSSTIEHHLATISGRIRIRQFSLLPTLNVERELNAMVNTQSNLSFDVAFGAYVAAHPDFVPSNGGWMTRMGAAAKARRAFRDATTI